jgi:hypothetical protein
MGDSIKITVIATGFTGTAGSRAEIRRSEAPRHPEPARVAPDPLPGIKAPANEPSRPVIESDKGGLGGFLRRGKLPAATFGNDEGGGYGPNYKGIRDDLDVPTFIRRQMD